jgi:hypothetical protein
MNKLLKLQSKRDKSNVKYTPQNNETNKIHTTHFTNRD